MTALPPWLKGRERHLTLIVPAAISLLVSGAFVVPNYVRAAALRNECRTLEANANDQLIMRSQLASLQKEVAALREVHATDVRPLCDLAADKLLDKVARPVDGQEVRNQGIRIGTTERLAKDSVRPQDVVKRTVTIEMDGSFKAVFAVLDDAERLNQLVVPARVEMAVSRGSANSTSGVRATIELAQYFRPAEGAK